jgi:hypothetical protein
VGRGRPEPGRSVHVLVRHREREIARIFKEGAVQLRLDERAPEISVEFRTDDTRGQLEISLEPEVRVNETTLFA